MHEALRIALSLESEGIVGMQTVQKTMPQLVKDERYPVLYRGSIPVILIDRDNRRLKPR
jgi:hypothetical protein